MEKEISWNLDWGKVPGWQGERHASWTLIAINTAVRQCLRKNLNTELSKLAADPDGKDRWELIDLQETAAGFRLTFGC